MKISGEGVLAHHFHGTYSCAVAIDFRSEASAVEALRVLGDGWRLGSASKSVVIGQLTSEQLDEFKVKAKEKWKLAVLPCGYSHCHHQCKNAEIDNVNHSVDYGGKFSVDIEFDAPVEQASLPGT